MALREIAPLFDNRFAVADRMPVLLAAAPLAEPLTVMPPPVAVSSMVSVLVVLALPPKSAPTLTPPVLVAPDAVPFNVIVPPAVCHFDSAFVPLVNQFAKLNPKS